jgi:hypothetical protein
VRTVNVRGLAAGVLAAGVPAYAAVRYRRWHLRWGATDDELAMALPGDDMVQRSHFNFTRAITIQARPEEIWPWLVQIGYGRGRLVQLRPARQPRRSGTRLTAEARRPEGCHGIPPQGNPSVGLSSAGGALVGSLGR